jgi:ATP-dependent DNA helicase RecG
VARWLFQPVYFANCAVNHKRMTHALFPLTLLPVAAFLGRAQQARNYALEPSTPMRDALTHLDLVKGDTPTNAAIVLFGKKPQRFLLSSNVKCLHFHGTKVGKPIPSYQDYKGDLFELVDQTIDFVMGKIDRSVGTRAVSNAAPETYEIPREAVAEAIVNAVAHRDYSSAASVQVMLFSDRLEIWNPGELPPSLTFAALRRPHASVPHNPLIAESLFLTRLVERAGTGIIDMLDLCEKSGLKPPEFRQDAGSFVQTLFRPTTANSTAQVGTKGIVFNTNALQDLAAALSTPTAHVTAQVAEQVRQVLAAAETVPQSRRDLQKAANISHREHFRSFYIEPLVKSGWVEPTIPDKPTSSQQKYRTTEKGRKWLAERTQ